MELIDPIAFLAVVVLSLVVLDGVQRSNRANIFIVSITLLTLLFFILAGIPHINVSNFANNKAELFTKPSITSINSAFHATALMFVSYTDYGRIATMSEEVRRLGMRIRFC